MSVLLTAFARSKAGRRNTALKRPHSANVISKTMRHRHRQEVEAALAAKERSQKGAHPAARRRPQTAAAALPRTTRHATERDAELPNTQNLNDSFGEVNLNEPDDTGMRQGSYSLNDQVLKGAKDQRPKTAQVRLSSATKRRDLTSRTGKRPKSAQPSMPPQRSSKDGMVSSEFVKVWTLEIDGKYYQVVYRADIASIWVNDVKAETTATFGDENGSCLDFTIGDEKARLRTASTSKAAIINEQSALDRHLASNKISDDPATVKDKLVHTLSVNGYKIPPIY